MFPYATATATEIEARARQLVGKRLIDLQPHVAPMRPSSPQTKGVVGRIYEACFDIPPNSIPGPDFIDAGIELKSVPILMAGKTPKAKERISVGMIDFDALGIEEWETASVRKKLERMLLIFYAWEPLQPIARFKTLAAGLWSPDPETWNSIEADWATIRELARSDRRGEVSESLTRVLGAATKGAGHGSTSRAWSLKQPFVGWVFRSMTGSAPIPEAVDEGDPAAVFESRTLADLSRHAGQQFDALSREVARGHLGGKAGVAAVVRALLQQPMHGRTLDFERYGIEIKTIPVDRNGRAVEAMSFPAFVHEELIYESWEDSDLLGRLNRLLIVPVHRERRGSLAETQMGRPFFWSPSEADLIGIRQEWERYRGLIEAGQSRDLPKASETTYIHVRPKGRDATDRDIAPGGFDVIKKCFWLNQHYVERILAENGALTAPPHR